MYILLNSSLSLSGVCSVLVLKEADNAKYTITGVAICIALAMVPGTVEGLCNVSKWHRYSVGLMQRCKSGL